MSKSAIGLILGKDAQGAFTASVADCEDLLAESVRHWAAVRTACVVVTGGPSRGMRLPIGLHTARKTQGRFPGSPVFEEALDQPCPVEYCCVGGAIGAGSGNGTRTMVP